MEKGVGIDSSDVQYIFDNDFMRNPTLRDLLNDFQLPEEGF
eukprot:SAG31_NODE_39649_length_286_cov_1.385027_1_plen_40_part_01